MNDVTNDQNTTTNTPPPPPREEASASPAATPPPPPTGDASEPAEPAAAPGMDPAEIEAGKLLAILGYIIGIVCIIPLIQKDNAFSLYHAKQVLLLIIAGVLLSVINVIPCLGQVVWALGSLALLVLGIMGLINAIKGKAEPVPLIGKYAEEWFKGIKKQA